MIQPLSEGAAAAGGWRVHKARRRDRVFEVIKIPAEVTTRGAICVQAQPAARRGLHAGSACRAARITCRLSLPHDVNYVQT